MSELDIALLASLPMLLLTLAGWFAASRLGRRITMAQARIDEIRVLLDQPAEVFDRGVGRGDERRDATDAALLSPEQHDRLLGFRQAAHPESEAQEDRRTENDQQQEFEYVTFDRHAEQHDRDSEQNTDLNHGDQEPGQHQSADEVAGTDRRHEQAFENAFAPVFDNVVAAAGNADLHDRQGQQARYEKIDIALRSRLHIDDSKRTQRPDAAKFSLAAEQSLLDEWHEHRGLPRLRRVDQHRQILGRAAVEAFRQNQCNRKIAVDNLLTEGVLVAERDAEQFVSFERCEEALAEVVAGIVDDTDRDRVFLATACDAEDQHESDREEQREENRLAVTGEDLEQRARHRQGRIHLHHSLSAWPVSFRNTSSRLP